MFTGLPNVKIMDALYFVAAYEFGLTVGIPVVVLTRTIYASINPWGPAGSLLIGFLVLGDLAYVLAASIVRKLNLFENTQGPIRRSVLLGLIGLFSALVFDLITNFGTGLLVVSPSRSLLGYLANAWMFGLITMNFPLPLGLVHEITDYFFFITVVPSAILLLKRSGILAFHSSTVMSNHRDDLFAN
jgi:hypothetical protein